MSTHFASESLWLTSLRSIGGEAEHFNPSHPLESVARGAPTVRALTDLTVDVVGDGAKGDYESSRRLDV